MILLCTASDDYIKKYSLCIESQKQYCKKYNYQYKLVNGNQQERNWKRAKVEELNKLLNNQDNDICLIDSDCLIKDTCPSFDVFLEADKSIYYVNGKSRRLNSGFLYFKNNNVTKQFVQDLIEKLTLQVPKGKGYYVTKEGENGHIIWLKDEYEKAGKNIFQKILKKWNCSSPLLKNDAYILHFTNDLKKEYNKYK